MPTMAGFRTTKTLAEMMVSRPHLHDTRLNGLDKRQPGDVVDIGGPDVLVSGVVSDIGLVILTLG